MKKLISLLFAVILFISCSDKTEVSGTLSTQEREVGNFTKISISDGIAVRIDRGTKGKVTVRTFTSVFDYVQTSVENNTLIIKVIDKTSFDRNPNISVTLPAEMITVLKLDGGSKIIAENTFFADNKGELSLAEGSSFEGNIVTNDLGMMLSGGSTMKINGTATNTKIGCEGGANIDGKSFETELLDIALNGGSIVYIKVSEKINKAVLRNGSKLYYQGPDYELDVVDINGGSKIEKF